MCQFQAPMVTLDGGAQKIARARVKTRSMLGKFGGSFW